MVLSQICQRVSILRPFVRDCCLVLTVCCALLGSRMLYIRCSPVPLYTPPLTVTPAVRELGTVRQKQKISCQYILTNTLKNKPIRLGEILKPCECTKLETSVKDIAPGETSLLQLTWETGIRRGLVRMAVMVPYTVGEITHNRCELIQTATVEPEIDYEPSNIRFSKNETNSLVKIKFTSKFDENMEITKVLPSSPALKVTKLTSNKFMVKKSEEYKIGKDEQLSLRVYSTNLVTPEFTVPVMVD